jgi:hypothetical protein
MRIMGSGGQKQIPTVTTSKSFCGLLKFPALVYLLPTLHVNMPLEDIKIHSTLNG